MACLATTSPQRYVESGRAEKLESCCCWKSAKSNGVFAIWWGEDLISNFCGWLSYIIVSKPRKYIAADTRFFRCTQTVLSQYREMPQLVWELVSWDTACSTDTALDKHPTSQQDVINVLHWKIGQANHVSVIHLQRSSFYHIPSRYCTY